MSAHVMAEKEGFLPMRKAMSEPVGAHDLLPMRRMPVYRGPNYTQSRLEAFGAQMELDMETRRWTPVVRMASFTKKEAIEEETSSQEEAQQDQQKDEDAKSTETIPTKKKDAVVVVDPFSTGALLAQRATEQGYAVIRVLSDGDSPVASLVAEGMHVDYVATVVAKGDTVKAYDDAAKELRQLPYKVHALLPGAETGVLCADELAARLGLRGNGNDPKMSKARRNKYLQGETVRRAGVRAVGQKLVRSWPEAEAFLKEQQAKKKTTGATEIFPVVVKPVESAGSDDVFKCRSAEDVRKAVEIIVGKENGLGQINDAALVQEFLKGEEYVVDSVSRDGVHKLCAIWHYDKRFVNGANFVYHGMRLVDASGGLDDDSEDVKLADTLVKYASKVLAALHVREGPSHMEVKVDPDDGKPCLVEVGARCHGGEGSWSPIARACAGYDQVDGVLKAYLDKDGFEALHPKPPKLVQHGAELFFVNRVSGCVRSTSKADAYLKALPSVTKVEWQLKEGDFAAKTVDCFTRPGSAQLVHPKKAQLEEDCAAIRALELSDRRNNTPPLLDLEFVCTQPIDRGTVVVVDPYSSGALLAARVRSRHRKKLLVVHSDPDSPIAGYVAAGTDVRAHATVLHRGDVDATLQDILMKVRGGAIVACVPGAETGVLLADELAERLGCRLNPTHLSVARRNKYVMGETVREAGVRAVKQCKAQNWAQAKRFLDEWSAELTRRHPHKTAASIYPVVVKPIESAGSDDVFKCGSSHEVEKAVNVICGKINGLGNVNEGALVQEFLKGDEFVVDAVSRDGVHKITAVWLYDKRSVNGTNFVYHGMRLVDFHSGPLANIAKKLAAYSNQIRDALEIYDGPSHMELMFDPFTQTPCLVEVGARCHGGEGTWLPVADACVSTNQVDATLDAYLDADAFDALPAVPAPFQKFGAEVFLVSHQSGIVDRVQVDKITKLQSFHKMELQVQPGSALKPTVDCFTRPGAVQLIHADPGVLQADYDAIRQFEKKGDLFLLR